LVRAEPDLRRDLKHHPREHDPGVGVHPRRQRLPPLRQPGPRGLVVGVARGGIVQGLRLGDDLRPGFVPKRLKPIDMVRMVVAEDDMADRLVGDALDLLQQRMPEARRTQRVEHHDSLVGHHEPGIRRVALVPPVRHARVPQDVVDGCARHLLDHKVLDKRSIRVRERPTGQDARQRKGGRAG